MQFNTYFVKVEDDSLAFEFFSVGTKGKIKKRISFVRFNPESSIFNLGFGDVDQNDGINDTVVTDNGDSRKVLLTVAYCTGIFFEKYSASLVYIQGSTVSRTRLYQIAIANNLEDISTNFNMYGFTDKWLPFEKGLVYKAFLVERKNN